MFNNKQETLKTLAIIGAFGALGIAASVVARIYFPFVGVVPAVSFTLIYTAIAINFILANGVADSVKGYFLDRFCKTLHKKHPKTDALYGELAFEREKLNDLINEYNNTPSQTKEQLNEKAAKKKLLLKQQIKYNNKFNDLNLLNQKEINAFNKYNNLMNTFLPVIIKESTAGEKVVAENQSVKQETKQVVKEKASNKIKAEEQEQQVVIQPLSENVLNQLKDVKAPKPEKEIFVSSKMPEQTLSASSGQKIKTK